MSGSTFSFKEIDDIGGSINDLVDVLAEVAREKAAEEAVDAPNAILKAVAKQRVKSAAGNTR